MLMWIVPEYVERVGDCCRVCRDDGEIVYEKKIDTVIKMMFREKLIDYGAAKRKSSNALNQNNLLPLYMGQTEILIPVKLRRAAVEKDTVHGYVNIFGISKVFEDYILMNDGSKISFYDAERNIRKRIKMARILEERFKEDTNPNDCMKHLTPASSKDVEAILIELHLIRVKLDELMQ